jgi:hypothetical protein
MRALKSFRLGLAAKLAICVVASTSLFFALFGFINLKMERQHSESLIERKRLTNPVSGAWSGLREWD